MKKFILLIFLSSVLFGCSNLSQKEQKALIGAGVGAVAGQALGKDTSSTLIGAGLGALGGVAVDNYQTTGNVLGQ